MTDIPLTREEQQRALRILRALKRFVDAYLAEEAESQTEREVMDDG